MKDNKWDQQEQRDLAIVRNRLGAKVELARQELEKKLEQNPEYKRLIETEREFYNGAYDQIKTARQRIVELATIHFPLELITESYRASDDHQSEQRIQLLEYRDGKGKSSGIFGLRHDESCSCSHHSHSFRGVELEEEGSIEKVIQEIRLCAKKGYVGYLDLKPLHLVPLFYLNPEINWDDRHLIDLLTRNIRREKQ